MMLCPSATNIIAMARMFTMSSLCLLVMWVILPAGHADSRCDICILLVGTACVDTRAHPEVVERHHVEEDAFRPDRALLLARLLPWRTGFLFGCFRMCCWVGVSIPLITFLVEIYNAGEQQLIGVVLEKTLGILSAALLEGNAMLSHDVALLFCGHCATPTFRRWDVSLCVCHHLSWAIGTKRGVYVRGLSLRE